MVALLLLFISFISYILIIYVAISSWREIIKKFDCVGLIFAMLSTSLAFLPVAYLIDILKFAK